MSITAVLLTSCRSLLSISAVSLASWAVRCSSCTFLPRFLLAVSSCTADEVFSGICPPQSLSICSGPLITAPPTVSMMATLNLPQRHKDRTQLFFCFFGFWIPCSTTVFAKALFPVILISGIRIIKSHHSRVGGYWQGLPKRSSALLLQRSALWTADFSYNRFFVMFLPIAAGAVRITYLLTPRTRSQEQAKHPPAQFSQPLPVAAPDDHYQPSSERYWIPS